MSGMALCFVFIDTNLRQPENNIEQQARRFQAA